MAACWKASWKDEPLPFRVPLAPEPPSPPEVAVSPPPPPAAVVVSSSDEPPQVAGASASAAKTRPMSATRWMRRTSMRGAPSLVWRAPARPDSRATRGPFEVLRGAASARVNPRQPLGESVVRRSVDALGELDDDPLRAAQVAETEDVAV